MSWTPEAGAGREARPRRRRNAAEERDQLRRLTVGTAVAAVGLNTVLFLQTAAGPLGAGDPTRAILSVIDAVLPGNGLGKPAQSPLPVQATPIAVSGAS